MCSGNISLLKFIFKLCKVAFSIEGLKFPFILHIFNSLRKHPSQSPFVSLSSFQLPLLSNHIRFIYHLEKNIWNIGYFIYCETAIWNFSNENSTIFGCVLFIHGQCPRQCLLCYSYDLPVNWCYIVLKIMFSGNKKCEQILKNLLKKCKLNCWNFQRCTCHNNEVYRIIWKLSQSAISVFKEWLILHSLLLIAAKILMKFVFKVKNSLHVVLSTREKMA